MAEPRKSITSAVVGGRSQRDRAKSLNDIISQQERLLNRLDENEPRYARVRGITNRYADNIFNTPESRADSDMIETEARSSDRVTEERGRRIRALNDSLYGRRFPRSVYARNR